MESILYSLLSSIIFGVLAYFAISFGSKKIANVNSSGSSETFAETQEKIGSLDQNLASVLDYSTPLVSGNDILKKEGQIDEATKALENEKQKLKELEENLKKRRKDVENAEDAHNSLKSAKDSSIELASELKENNRKLESEYKKLDSELTQSLSKLDALSKSIKMTPDQVIGMNKIQSASANSNQQLKSLRENYKQTSKRFVALQEQYSDLEKEFGKLIEKELTD